MRFKYTPTNSDMSILRVFMIVLTILIAIALGSMLTTCTQTDNDNATDSDLGVLSESPSLPDLMDGNGVVNKGNKQVPGFDSDDMLLVDTGESVIPDPLEKITNDHIIDNIMQEE